MWIVAAIGSAFFAGVTSILAKLGINKTDSDVATAIRTIVVLAFSWLMAAITGQIGAIVGVTGESWVFPASPRAQAGSATSRRSPWVT